MVWQAMARDSGTSMASNVMARLKKWALWLTIILLLRRLWRLCLSVSRKRWYGSYLSLGDLPVDAVPASDPRTLITFSGAGAARD